MATTKFGPPPTTDEKPAVSTTLPGAATKFGTAPKERTPQDQEREMQANIDIIRKSAR